MTKEQHIIDVVSAFMAGKKIECAEIVGKPIYHICPAPSWDFNAFYYRIAPDTPDVYPWEAINPKWKWAARDKYGSIYLYTMKPVCCPDSEEWILQSLHEDAENITDVLHIQIGSADWKDSLVERPS